MSQWLIGLFGCLLALLSGSVAQHAPVVNPDSDLVAEPEHVRVADVSLPTPPAENQEADALAWLTTYEADAQRIYVDSVRAGWAYFTDMTEGNRHKLMDSELALGDFTRHTAAKARQFNVTTFRNQTLQRLVRKLMQQDMSALPPDQFMQYTLLQSAMSHIFSNATVCELGKQAPCTQHLDPDINQIVTTSRDFGTLFYYWQAWRNAVGPPMRPLYMDFVKLGNEGAKLNDFADMGEMWRAEYETENLAERLEIIFQQLLPFYKQLHAYMRRSLGKMYPGYLYKDRAMPAHILGNVWANSWINLYDYSAPYPGKFTTNPTVAMYQQNYTVDKMFHEAERFYMSLGFPALPDNFWNMSMLTKPVDRDVVCLPAAVDFRDRTDFRVKMCAAVSADDFVQVHHQLGHIYYYMAYKDQPIAFRDGANPAFHDAVGASISMLVRTPEHFHRLGLLPQLDADPEADINFLFLNALDRIVFLPYAYVVDLWRWQLFSGQLNESNANLGWWEMREKYQGITAPLPRTEKDFDPAESFHVAQNMPYIKYFISYIIQFQFLKALCAAAGHTGPLIKCDIDGSTEAGHKLRAMLALGSSEPWPMAMERLTGQRDIDVGPLLEYFEPLHNWLKAENAKHQEYVGWDGPGVLFEVPSTTSKATITTNESSHPDFSQFLRPSGSTPEFNRVDSSAQNGLNNAVEHGSRATTTAKPVVKSKNHNNGVGSVTAGSKLTFLLLSVMTCMKSFK